MADLESSKIDNKLETLRTILYQIMVNTSNSGESSSKDIGQSAVVISYMPLLYTEMLKLASGVQSLSDYQESRYRDNLSKKNDYTVSDSVKHISQKTEELHKDNNEIITLMSTLSNRQESFQDNQNNYFNDLVANTEDFVDLSQEDKKKEGILSKLVGSVKGAVSGFVSSLFAPKSKTVILAKSTIKDIAGVIKAFSPENKASLKDKIKDKAADNIAEALTGVVKKVGDAVVKAIKGIQLALEIFIYAIFPLVILGAVGILVIGLYFIAEMVMEHIGGLIGSIGEAFKMAVEGIMNYILAPFKLISQGIETLGNLLLEPLKSIGEGVKSILESIGPAIGEFIVGIKEVIVSNVDKIGLIIEGIGRGINKFVDIITDIWEGIKSITANGLLKTTTGAIGTVVSGAASLFGIGNNGNTDGVNFNDLTDKICQSINDFASMVKGYLSSLAVQNVFKTVKTNITGNSNMNNFSSVDDDTYSSSTMSQKQVNTNTSNNTSYPTDGAPNQAFNTSTISRFSNDYSVNTLNGNTNNHNDEVVKYVKETNSLLRELISMLSLQRSNNFSIIGD